MSHASSRPAGKAHSRIFFMVLRLPLCGGEEHPACQTDPGEFGRGIPFRALRAGIRAVALHGATPTRLVAGAQRKETGSSPYRRIQRWICVRALPIARAVSVTFP